MEQFATIAEKHPKVAARLFPELVEILTMLGLTVPQFILDFLQAWENSQNDEGFIHDDPAPTPVPDPEPTPVPPPVVVNPEPPVEEEVVITLPTGDEEVVLVPEEGGEVTPLPDTPPAVVAPEAPEADPVNIPPETDNEELGLIATEEELFGVRDKKVRGTAFLERLSALKRKK